MASPVGRRTGKKGCGSAASIDYRRCLSALRQEANVIRLHYYPSNASFAPHVLLHELGVPFERVLVDRTQGAHKSPTT
jgi:hypothetical protein